ncbi:MAG: DRTGG domain-containing protein [Bacteroidales bacterium]|jgi:predicted transcriptional regulator
MALTVGELANRLGLRIFCGEENTNRVVKGGYVSDLLSDVMGFAKEGEVWITLQTHKNVIAIASLKDLSAVILVKGYVLEDDALQKAIEEGIPVLGTDKQTFETVGKIYELIG